MIIIGEKLNSSIPSTMEAFNNNDVDFIKNVINKNIESGANYLDINTAMCLEELDKMKEIINLVLDNSDLGIMIDSTNMEVVKEALKIVGERPCIINSISFTTDVCPLEDIDLSNIGVVAMPTDENAMTEDGKSRFEKVEQLTSKLIKLGFKEENIYADLLIETLAVNQQSGKVALDTLKIIKESELKIKTTCGASNVAFGLPNRGIINCSFISILSYLGLDSIICDPISEYTKNALVACDVILGKDEYCMNYINYIRN